MKETRRQRLQKENLKAMILPPQFKWNGIQLPNLIYKRIWVAYDDEP